MPKEIKKTTSPQCVKNAVMQSVTATDLRIGNIYEYFISDKNDDRKEWWEVVICDAQDLVYLEKNPNDRDFRFLKLTEEYLVKLGFSVINESSAGKRYGYIVNGVFSSDLTFTFWKTTKEAGKFFKGDLELKAVHQIQNLYFALTGRELTVA